MSVPNGPYVPASLDLEGRTAFIAEMDIQYDPQAAEAVQVTRVVENNIFSHEHMKSIIDEKLQNGSTTERSDLDNVIAGIKSRHTDYWTQIEAYYPEMAEMNEQEKDIRKLKAFIEDILKAIDEEELTQEAEKKILHHFL